MYPRENNGAYGNGTRDARGTQDFIPPPAGGRQTSGRDAAPLYPTLQSGRPGQQPPAPPTPPPVHPELQRHGSDASATRPPRGHELWTPNESLGRASTGIPQPSPNVHPSALPPRTAARQPCKKALLIGCNYPNDPSDQLHSCVNDARRMYTALTEHFGYDRQNVRLLVDDGNVGVPSPTRQNIVVSMKWLVNDARKGDRLFFHFSGHGTCSPDYTGDEKRKENQCLMPTDYRQAGLLVDDDINQILVRPLPEGCTLHALLDCCHSGTVMDLQFSAKNGQWVKDGNTKYYKGSCGGHVFQFAACKDGQSAYGSESQFNSSGAATSSFINAMTASPQVTYTQILHFLTQQVQQFAKEHQPRKDTFSEKMKQKMMPFARRPIQIPQLSSNTNAVSLNDVVNI